MFHLVSVRMEKSRVWGTSLLDGASPFLLLNLELEVDYLISSLANVMQTRANSFGHYFPTAWFEFQKYISHRVFKTEKQEGKQKKDINVQYYRTKFPIFLNCRQGSAQQDAFAFQSWYIWILTETSIRPFASPRCVITGIHKAK